MGAVEVVSCGNIRVRSLGPISGVGESPREGRASVDRHDRRSAGGAWYKAGVLRGSLWR
ncbi:hypothetical protein PHLGIDRAFT_180097 [Phlebiopsis gigantea 11061_1 CR5-6]|uniref:Uncharacterized protein n=1 Tax=Phlebiopsis gigantea (strain 11061_1 CR5-6) TaxID=745531 RepID=A0A0C3PGE9_PHLG1|nr:hypothetical protein PHLGIDRAFT_180097 [Phlebiopsis gigantea 11061_1 CR5-6]